MPPKKVNKPASSDQAQPATTSSGVDVKQAKMNSVTSSWEALTKYSDVLEEKIKLSNNKSPKLDKTDNELLTKVHNEIKDCDRLLVSWFRAEKPEKKEQLMYEHLKLMDLKMAKQEIRKFKDQANKRIRLFFNMSKDDYEGDIFIGLKALSIQLKCPESKILMDTRAENSQRKMLKNGSTTAKPPKKEDNASNSCAKCYRTSLHCEDAKTKLKEEQILVKSLKKELEQMKSEKNLLEQRASTNCKQCSLINAGRTRAEEELVLEQLKTDALGKELAVAKSDLEVTKKRMKIPQEIIAENKEKDATIKFLEGQLKDTRKTNKIEDMNNLVIQNEQIVKECRSKDIMIESLKAYQAEQDKKWKQTNEIQEAENIELSFLFEQEKRRKEEKEREVEELKHRLNCIQFTQYQTSTRLTDPEEVTKKLEELTEMAKNINLDQVEKIEKQLELVNDKEFNEFCNQEVKRFLTDHQKYSFAVTQNIKIIQDTRSFFGLFKIPQFPVFSEGFLDIFEKRIQNHRKIVDAQKKGQMAARDPKYGVYENCKNECYVCYYEMTGQEPTIECSMCKNKIHLKCANDWSKVKSLCPVCNRLMLDSAAFPPLS